MIKITLLFGIAEIFLGLIAFFGTGAQHVTALIPAVFGLLLVICGLVARKDNLRKHAMHGAAMVGLLGAGGTFSSLLKIGSLISGTAERPVAVVTQLIFFGLSVTFLIICIRSFIAARKARQSAA
jgi:uncharacterized membrane protein